MNQKPPPIWTRPLWPNFWPLKAVSWLLRSPWWLLCGLFNWRMIKRYLFCLACLFTLAAIFYVEENWRGNHAWEKFKREQEAKGEKLDFQAFIPPPVPDDQNFAITRFWEDARYQWNLHRQGVQRVDLDTNLANLMSRLRFNIYRSGSGKPYPPDLGSWGNGTNVDLKAWQEYYRALAKEYRGVPLATPTNEFPIPPQPGEPASDVLLALTRFNEPLQLLRAATNKPLSRFPIDYADGSNIYLHHLAKLLGTANYLKLLAVAELESGQSDQAAQDLSAIFYLADSIRSEPFQISYLVRLRLLNTALDTLWRGLIGRKWSAEQLKSFQDRLLSENLVRNAMQAVRADCANACAEIDNLAASRLKLLSILREGVAIPREAMTYFRWAPRGWFDREKILYAGPKLEALAAYDPQAQRMDFNRLNAIEPALKADDQQLPMWRDILDWSGVRNIQEFAERVAAAQTSLNLAAVACALERFWSVKGAYPEKLEKLVPQFIGKLPHEVATGDPLKYRRTDDGRFVLYSTGVDGKDSGGLYRMADGKRTGNWVWRYPAK